MVAERLGSVRGTARAGEIVLSAASLSAPSLFPAAPRVLSYRLSINYLTRYNSSVANAAIHSSGEVNDAYGLA